MVKRPTIAVDIDDVLAPLNEAMMHFVNKEFGTKHTWADYTVVGPYAHYWNAQVWGVPHEEAEERYKQFVSSGAHFTTPVMPGAITALKHLKKRFDLVVVTARNHSYMDATHAWLNKHFPDVFQSIHFTPLRGDGDQKVEKASVVAELGASYLIDDHIGHCLPAARAGVTCLLFGDYGWNKDAVPTNMVRVKDWRAVQEYFDGIEL